MFAQEIEHRIKTAFIKKIAKYVEWNQNNLPTDTFVIAIMGDIPFDGMLHATYINRKIIDLPVKIYEVKNISEIKDCHFIFITENYNSKIEEICTYAIRNNILTISNEIYARKNKINISFYITEKNTVHFKINNESVKKAGLTIGSVLLEYAKFKD